MKEVKDLEQHSAETVPRMNIPLSFF